MEMRWFDPHVEFRFPTTGRSSSAACRWNAAAIEPWHVLGEERRREGLCRFVDFVAGAVAGAGEWHGRPAARDRGQRRAGAAASDGDHMAVRCRRAVSGLAAAGVPASRRSRCIRRWCSTWWIRGRVRSIGGCKYYVSTRAGGIRYVPGERVRGEGRRLSRFFQSATPPGAMRVVEPPVSKEFRLRWI